MLENFDNYGPYSELIKTGKLKIYTKDITKENVDNHFFWILNIFRDGIELEEVQKSFVNIEFNPNAIIYLSLEDLLCNVIMWDIIVNSDMMIEPKHLFFDTTITQKSIKSYVDIFFLDEKRKEIPNIKLNNMIDSMMFKWCYIDEFNGFLANTVNLEDFVELMDTNPEFNGLLHSDLTGVPLEDVKAIGMGYANRMIDIIKNSDHCLSNFFNAEEGVNPKQFKEVAVNIGTKPDGRGGVYPTLINTNFLTGGVNDTLSFFIEESGGRIAQIIVEGNVGISGYFARLLGLNNLDTTIHRDPSYVCDTKNFQEVSIPVIGGAKILSKFENRYYRLNPNGEEYLLKRKDIHLIGKTIYLRSPMTCSSHASGHGICYRCYGDLAYTNNDINIGKIAAEEVSSKLTQRMLSAKHLLESAIKKIKWSPEFTRFFDLEYDIIKVTSDDSINLNNYKILISDIRLQSDHDNVDYNEYIEGAFEVLSPNGDIFNIHTDTMDDLYITSELNTVIREKATDYDGKLCVDFKELYDVPLFIIEMQNSDLSTTLTGIKNIIDKSAITNSLTRHEVLQSLVETFIEGGIDVMSIHGEVILSNQLRNVDNILETPEWKYPNEPYKLLTLSQSLSKNPSVTVSLSYEGLSKMLYNPLTYRKNKPSYLDLFFKKDIFDIVSNKDNVNKASDDGYIQKDSRKVITFGSK